MDDPHEKIEIVHGKVKVLIDRMDKYEGVERRMNSLELWVQGAVQNLQLGLQATAEKVNNMCAQVSKTENHLSSAINQNTADIKELNDNIKEFSKDIKALLEFKANEKGKSEAYWKVPAAAVFIIAVIGIAAKFWNHFQ